MKGIVCCSVFNWFFLWTCQQWLFVDAKFYLYDTQSRSEQLSIQFNCLQYSDLKNWDLIVTIEYCLRPSESQGQWWNEGQPADHYQRFTFQQLSSLNITADNLLEWSTSADLAEDFQYYLNSSDDQLAFQEVFRCIQPWFGPRCQYSFVVQISGSFFATAHRLITTKIRTKVVYNESYATCYTHLKCQHEGIPICLHWNQICDGRIDCIDGAEDELPCFDLEMNECQNDEYRCHNGLCIPQNFLNDQTAECLDQSDVIMGDESSHDLHDIVKAFVWKEYGCRPGENTFICGDSRCVRDFETCQSGRHLMINTFITNQGTLTKQCWMIMVCLTKIMDQVDGIGCQSFISSIHINQSIDYCQPLIQFPTKPVLLHHVYFLYHRNDLFIHWTGKVLIPAYICYDRHLCEHLHPTFYYRNMSCRTASEMSLDNSSISYSTWLSMIDAIRSQFNGCMLFRRNASSPLYCCQNSSKCISRHRVVDGIIDCPYHDDEQAFELSCSIRNQRRFRCDDEEQCRSLLYRLDVCPPRRFRNLKEILFQEICNRIPQTTPELIDGTMHNDETECEQWPCSNIYTRCDHYWHCPNGEDEVGCTESSVTSRPTCPIGTLECVSPLNHTFICLSSKQVVDGVVDCLGGIDEQTICRQNIQTADFPGFLCYNQTKCILPSDLCDTVLDCQHGDDEAFCNQSIRVCYGDSDPFTTDVQQSICHFAHGKRKFFSFNNLPTYSISQKTISHHSIRPSRSSISQDISTSIQSLAVIPPHPWYCHDGLAALVRLGPDQYGTRCFCPPTFYGDRCQYQNQRVAITISLYPVSKQGVQSFFISLISEDGQDREQIQSHHQFSYVVENHCGKTYKFFLLYSTRPKNLSMTYFVKIDAYEQTTLTYLASWRYPIQFLFLPVNPMVIAIRVPAKPISSGPIRCELQCVHGRCMKYLNSNDYYCKCDQGWTGKQCQQRINGTDCASDSICLGLYQNRSICMCPINRFGRRCLLEYSCSSEWECMNGGKCVIVDRSRIDEGYGCLCPKEYHGILCHIQKNVLQLTFENIDMSPHLLLHVYEIKHVYSLETSKAKLNVHAQKLRMFEKSATFYVKGLLQVAFIQVGMKYYLIVSERAEKMTNISTTITPKQECPHFKRLATAPLSRAPEIRRVKSYHQICRLHSRLMCFIDDNYFCLCTTERHANCLPMERNFRCPQDLHCQNGAECIQERPECPSMTFCRCTDCFFGDRCQFYAKGIGLTLDDILRYELRPKTSLHDQPVSVKTSVAFAIIIFVVGIVNSIFALMTFYRDEARQVGAGMYLLASSITSLLTIIIFNIKFWFLIATNIPATSSRISLHAACVTNEAILKLCLYTDSWLNACVAIERAITIYKGTTFNRKRSKTIAKWMVFVLPILICSSLLHEFLYRQLYDDQEEERIWCILQYSSKINAYSTFILSFHTVTPFAINLISATVIIVRSARRKANIQRTKSFSKHLKEQLKDHRHLIISPIILALLSLPRVIISLKPGCVKANRSVALYLTGYLISLVPSVTIFLIFVLPSPLYRGQFYKSSQRFKEIFISTKRPKTGGRA